MYWHPEATARAVARRRPAGDDRRRRSSTPTATPRAMRSTALRRASSSWRARGRGDRAGARPALDLHRQRGAAALDRRARRRARAAGPDPPLRDRAGGRATASPRTACARPPTSTGSGCWASARVLAHGVWLDRDGAGADRRARRHRRHQPGRQHEARGRRRLPLPGRARGRASRSGSAPTAPAPTTRSTCSPTSRLFALAQKHAAGDPTAIAAAEAWAIATGARAPLLGAGGRSTVGAAGRLPAAARRRARARHRRPRLRPRLRRLAARSSTPPWSAAGC